MEPKAKRMNKIRQRVRNSLMAKIDLVDFTKMGKEEYGDWINALPVDEFMALLNIHDEFKHPRPVADPKPTPKPDHSRLFRDAKKRRNTREHGAPGDNDWIPSGEGMPVGPETVVFVLFPDGDIGGPNPAHMFMWDEPHGPSQILAYALAGSS